MTKKGDAGVSPTLSNRKEPSSRSQPVNKPVDNPLTPYSPARLGELVEGLRSIHDQLEEERSNMNVDDQKDLEILTDASNFIEETLSVLRKQRENLQNRRRQAYRRKRAPGRDQQ